MKVTAVQDDGTTADITALVQNAYERLWLGTRFDRDWPASVVESFAELARALGHPSADDAAEIAADVRATEEAERAERIAWQKQRANAVVEALSACG